MTRTINGYIAETRFGFGVMGGPLYYQSKPKAMLLQSVEYGRIRGNSAQSEAIIADYLAHQAANRAAAKAGDVPSSEARASYNKAFRDAVANRLTVSVFAENPFHERLLQFWSNHFAIDAKSLVLRALAPDFERQGIGPHVGGRFSDMLKSAVLHPAMLIFLDQVNSIGPNSIAGLRGKKARAAKGKKSGLNENLAREILELHTLGVDGGYTQTDVEELARAMTGHSIAHYSQQRDAIEASARFPIGRVMFMPALHEPGERKVMGGRYRDSGEQQLHSILESLAIHPSTARFLATKLARHFVADTPPVSMVDSMAAAYLQSGGELMALYNAMLDAPESWQLGARKFKSPWDWTVSACIFVGRQVVDRVPAAKFVEDLGQKVWQPGSPAGFGDRFTDWASPDGLVRRAAAAEKLGKWATSDALDEAKIDLNFPSPPLPDASKRALLGAESLPAQRALALVLPEFQWR